MKRPDVREAAAAGGCPDAAFAKLHPSLSEYLCDDRYEDGTKRELSSIQLKVQDGMILAVLQDHDLERSLYVVGESLGRALLALEKHCTAPDADWRRWGGKRKRK